MAIMMMLMMMITMTEMNPKRDPFSQHQMMKIENDLKIEKMNTLLFNK